MLNVGRNRDEGKKMTFAGGEEYSFIGGSVPVTGGVRSTGEFPRKWEV